MANHIPEVYRPLNQTQWLSKLDSDQDLLSLYLLRFDRPHTKRSYQSDIERFFLHVYHTKEITLDLVRQVNFVIINTYLVDLEAQGLKPATLQRKLAALRGFFDWLLALNVIESNPANRQLVRKIKKVNYKDRAIVVLSAPQARQLLAATEQASDAAVRDRAILSVMLHCVLRRSEVAAMDAEHLIQLGPYWVVTLPETKGGSDQYVKIPAHVVEDVHVHQQKYGITTGPLWRSLSNNHFGKRLSPAAIYEMVKRTAIRAGLNNQIGAHTLRHTGCTLAIDSGASIQQVQAHARHKTIDTTLVYVHQRDKLKNSAADHIHI